MRFDTVEGFRRYLSEAALAPYERGRELAHRVADRVTDRVADFVRLHVLARRPGVPTR